MSSGTDVSGKRDAGRALAAVVMASIMLISTIAVASPDVAHGAGNDSYYHVNGLLFEYSGTEAVTVVGLDTDFTGTHVFIPDYIPIDAYMNFTVEGIAAEAFKDCNTITSVYIPSSVTTIGDDAFLGCGNLQSFMVSPDSDYFYATESGLLIDKTDGEQITLVCVPSSFGGSVIDLTDIEDLTVVKSHAIDNVNSLRILIMNPSSMDLSFESVNNCTNLDAIVFESEGTLADNSIVNLGDVTYCIERTPSGTVDGLDRQDDTTFSPGSIIALRSTIGGMGLITVSEQGAPTLHALPVTNWDIDYFHRVSFNLCKESLYESSFKTTL